MYFLLEIFSHYRFDAFIQTLFFTLDFLTRHFCKVASYPQKRVRGWASNDRCKAARIVSVMSQNVAVLLKLCRRDELERLKLDGRASLEDALASTIAHLEALDKELQSAVRRLRAHQSSLEWFSSPVAEVPVVYKKLISLYIDVFIAWGDDSRVTKLLSRQLLYCARYFGVLVYPCLEQAGQLAFTVLAAFRSGSELNFDLIPLLLSSLEIFENGLERMGNLRKALPIASKYVLFPMCEILFRWAWYHPRKHHDVLKAVEMKAIKFWQRTAFEKSVVHESESQGTAKCSELEISDHLLLSNPWSEPFPAAQSYSHLLQFFAKCIALDKRPEYQVTQMAAFYTLPLVLKASLSSGHGLPSAEKFSLFLELIRKFPVESAARLLEPELPMWTMQRMLFTFKCLSTHVHVDAAEFELIYDYVVSYCNAIGDFTAANGCFVELLDLNFNEAAKRMDDTLSLAFRKAPNCGRSAVGDAQHEFWCSKESLVVKFITSFGQSRLLNVLFANEGANPIYRHVDQSILLASEPVEAFLCAFKHSIEAVRLKTVESLLSALQDGISNGSSKVKMPRLEKSPGDETFEQIADAFREKLGLFTFLAVALEQLPALKLPKPFVATLSSLTDHFGKVYVEFYEGLWVLSSTLRHLRSDFALDDAVLRRLLEFIAQGESHGASLQLARVEIFFLLLENNRVPKDACFEFLMNAVVNLQSPMSVSASNQGRINLPLASKSENQSLTWIMWERFLQHLPLVEHSLPPGETKEAIFQVVVSTIALFPHSLALENLGLFELPSFSSIFVRVVSCLGLGLKSAANVSVEDLQRINLEECAVQWNVLLLLTYVPPSVLNSTEKEWLARLGAMSFKCKALTQDLILNCQLVQYSPTNVMQDFDPLIYLADADLYAGFTMGLKGSQSLFTMAKQWCLTHYGKEGSSLDKACLRAWSSPDKQAEVQCAFLEYARVSKIDLRRKWCKRFVRLGLRETTRSNVYRDTYSYVVRYIATVKSGQPKFTKLVFGSMPKESDNACVSTSRVVSQLELLLNFTDAELYQERVVDGLLLLIDQNSIGDGLDYVSQALERVVMKILPAESVAPVTFGVLDRFRMDVHSLDSLLDLALVVAESYRVGRKQGLHGWLAKFLNLVNPAKVALGSPQILRLVKVITQWVNIPHFLLSEELFASLCVTFLSILKGDVADTSKWNVEQSFEFTELMVNFLNGAVHYHRKSVFKSSACVVLTTMQTLLNAFRDYGKEPFIERRNADSISSVLQLASKSSKLEKLSLQYARLVNALILRPTNSTTRTLAANSHLKPILKLLPFLVARFHSISCTKQPFQQPEVQLTLRKAMFAILDVLSPTLLKYLMFNQPMRTRPVFKSLLLEWESSHKYKGQS